ncbi:MAG: T9SS type A sorting domain-containing protein, partial [Bacteroidetes bacterium]|nr:T9SS type A sorting domain-containing protein [Bacteroidota bacterium]
IKVGHWDYVVLQGQSYELSLAHPETTVFIYAHNLDTIIRAYNPCSETMYYMTWGRKNGDTASCPTIPYLCTYQSMDSMIRLNYMQMAVVNSDIVSPVGAVRHYIRQYYPSIELYQSDESHPSLAGTYAAACCFYAAIFRKDPGTLTFNPGISSTDALNIRTAAKTVAYDSLHYWHIGQYDSLITARCQAATGITDIKPHANVMLYPNPATDAITIQTENKKQLVQVYNYMGAIVNELEISGSTLLNISTLPKGIYFLHINNGQQQTYKFAKQ